MLTFPAQVASLFDTNERLTPKATEISQEFEKLLWPLMTKYVSEGYSVRELAFLYWLAINELTKAFIVVRISQGEGDINPR